ncbi:Uncharacterised protein [uncultured Ruminococcus sp.]|nr:Uncharacterised protein [uncultured Clostridium sp.]SCH94500.1 Uncharacterised protein [uncultured Ruminococcus sp.]
MKDIKQKPEKTEAVRKRCQSSQDSYEGPMAEVERKAVSDEQTAVSSNDPANSAAEQYRFTPEQDRQPAKLLKLENQSLWSAALYGIGNNSGDLVTLALSQVGNARGLSSSLPHSTHPERSP